jgi:hypothetical protein
MLKDISFSKNSEDPDDFTVYIQESDVLVPYLAISSDYEGGILLLRKYLLDETVPFSYEKSQGSSGGYYPASYVDGYLNGTFFERLAPELRELINNTAISVSTLEGVGSGGGDRGTEIVQRKIFLLSATELNIKSGMASSEGKALDYFKKVGSVAVGENGGGLVAIYENGEADAYWLRSAYHWDDIQAWSVGSDGTCGGSSVSLDLAIRPAFCLPGDTVIDENHLLLLPSRSFR